MARCKYCKCTKEGRHKVWCRSREAVNIKTERIKELEAERDASYQTNDELENRNAELRKKLPTKAEAERLSKWGDSVKHNFTWTKEDEELLKKVETW